MRKRAHSFPDREAFLSAAREGKRNWAPVLEERTLAGMREEDGELVVAASLEAAGRSAARGHHRAADGAADYARPHGTAGAARHVRGVGGG